MPKYVRWYDNDEDLVQLFRFLENIEERQQKVIANEVLQIVFRELNIDPNEKVRELSMLKPFQNKRWYDANVEVQSAVEVTKNLTHEQRHELVGLVIETLRQLIIKDRFD